MWAIVLLFLAILLFPHSVVGFVPPSTWFADSIRTRQTACSERFFRDGRLHNASAVSPRVQIRDWKKGDGDAINELLRSAEAYGVFNPEGDLEMDCETELLLSESYRDGGCFLVAELLMEDQEELVGTAGLIVGTPIAYQTSGSSMSSPEMTAAVRRCVVCQPTGIESLSTESIQKQLLDAIEERAVQAKATQLIGLAYPASQSVPSQGVKPIPQILQELGYQALAQQLPGVDAVQYGKDLTSQTARNDDIQQQQVTAMSSTDSSTESNGISEIAFALVLLVGSIAGGTSLVGQFLGLDTSLSSSTVVNRGLGRPLSTEDLGQLLQDEQLQRKTLDDSSDGGRSRIGREWEDLTLEERREELALLQVIQGQNVRVK